MSRKNDTDHRVAGRIRQAASARDYTIRRLADETAMPYRTLQDRLTGQQAIPVEALGKIASALHVSADWLLFGREATLDLVILGEALDALDDQGRMSLRQRAKWLGEMYQFLYNDEFNVNVQPAAESTTRASARRPRR